jgi:hypothetical protein
LKLFLIFSPVVVIPNENTPREIMQSESYLTGMKGVFYIYIYCIKYFLHLMPFCCILFHSTTYTTIYPAKKSPSSKVSPSEAVLAAVLPAVLLTSGAAFFPGVTLSFCPGAYTGACHPGAWAGASGENPQHIYSFLQFPIHSGYHSNSHTAIFEGFQTCIPLGHLLTL